MSNYIKNLFDLFNSNFDNEDNMKFLPGFEDEELIG
jgi:hypothetical protein